MVLINCQLPLAHGSRWLAILVNGMTRHSACHRDWGVGTYVFRSAGFSSLLETS